MQMSLLPPAPPVPLANRPRRGVVRWAVQRIRAYARGVQAPSAGNAEQALYGFAQPILGARVLLADPELLKEALFPRGCLAPACRCFPASGPRRTGLWGPGLSSSTRRSRGLGRCLCFSLAIPSPGSRG